MIEDPAAAFDGWVPKTSCVGVLAFTVTVGCVVMLTALPVPPFLEAVVNVSVPAVVGAVASEYVNVNVLVPSQV
jgi:uncharacterized membrane protein